MEKLLSRNEFREQVFSRDGHKCVFCGAPGQDAHHILERRLFGDGGYYLSNGVTVCHEHHLKCESTEISAQDARHAAGIKRIILPEHLYSDQEYDKWGNPILSNGLRLRGELFQDSSVQKILKDYLHLFTDKVKYHRTYHLPWSPGIHDDDRMIDNVNHFHGREVVVLEKMDGQNFSLYRDFLHARSVESAHHPSQDRIKNKWAQICGDIPEGWRLNVENLYAKHSIHYLDLKAYEYGFSIWNEKNVCLNWDETKEWFQLFDIPTPVEFYRGIYNEKEIKLIWKDSMWENCEGYVLRPVDSFPYSEFRKWVLKFVRKNHIMTGVHHWASQKIIPNRLEV